MPTNTFNQQNKRIKGIFYYSLFKILYQKNMSNYFATQTDISKKGRSSMEKGRIEFFVIISTTGVNQMYNVAMFKYFSK